jgi:hypothetical protein
MGLSIINHKYASNIINYVRNTDPYKLEITKGKADRWTICMYEPERCSGGGEKRSNEN